MEITEINKWRMAILSDATSLIDRLGAIVFIYRERETSML